MNFCTESTVSTHLSGAVRGVKASHLTWWYKTQTFTHMMCQWHASFVFIHIAAIWTYPLWLRLVSICSCGVLRGCCGKASTLSSVINSEKDILTVCVEVWRSAGVELLSHKQQRLWRLLFSHDCNINGAVERSCCHNVKTLVWSLISFKARCTLYS